MDDLFYSPPVGRGKPSYQALQAKAARQQARLDFLRQHTQLAASLSSQATQNLQRNDSAGSSASSSDSDRSPPPPPPTTITATTATEVETQTLASGEASRRYRNYSITFKLHVANHALHNSIRATARHFGLDRKVVRAWLNNNESFQTQNRIQSRNRVARGDVSRAA
jgi:hypothetical protein